MCQAVGRTGAISTFERDGVAPDIRTLPKDDLSASRTFGTPSPGYVQGSGRSETGLSTIGVIMSETPMQPDPVTQPGLPTEPEGDPVEPDTDPETTPASDD